MEYGSNTPIDEVAREITGDNYRLLVLIGEFDAREGYLEFGMQSCAHSD